MPAPAPPPELLRSLGHLVRGLSALFWGLPITLVVCVQTAKTNLLWFMGVSPPMLAWGLLLFGLLQVGRFKPRERIWTQALDRAKLLALINLGLSPFLYWSRMAPDQPVFGLIVWLLFLSSLCFVTNLNRAMQRLAAMLPDETLRLETRLFTSVNLALLILSFTLAAGWVAAYRLDWLPRLPLALLLIADRVGLFALLLMVLLPIALTMALLWRLKEAILASVFAHTSGA